MIRVAANLGATVLIVASLAACTSTPRPAPTTSPTSSTATSEATAAASEAIALPPNDEQVLGHLDSKRGIFRLGPYAVTTPRIAVYAVCRGAGTVTVVIDGVGSFPMDCSTDPTAPGVRNVFDVSYVQTLSIEGQGDNSLLWGLSVTAIPNS
jgi:hypothetical protein